MTMPEILRRKLMERIDIASEPDDGEVLEEIDGLILGEEETRYLPVAQKAELRRQLFYSVRRLDVLQELLEDAGITEIMVNGYQHISWNGTAESRDTAKALPPQKSWRM